MGIVIHGDYEDLQLLRDALSRCNDFYYDSRADLYEYVNKARPDEKLISQWEREREFFLSLNYDIRHACMGDRNYELVENGSDSFDDKQSYFDDYSDTYEKYGELYKMTKYGNLQYSVEILYPMAIYYMYSVNDYLTEICEDSFLDNLTVDYSTKFKKYPDKHYVLYQDIGILMQFYGLLLQALSEVLGETKMNHLTSYMNDDIHMNSGTVYPEALCHYYCNMAPKTNKTTKKAMILTMAYELFNSTEAINSGYYKSAARDYKAAIKKISEKAEIPFPEADDFYKKLNQFIKQLDGAFYYDDFDRFLEQEYGKSDDAQDIFETNPWPEILR